MFTQVERMMPCRYLRCARSAEVRGCLIHLTARPRAVRPTWLPDHQTPEAPRLSPEAPGSLPHASKTPRGRPKPLPRPFRTAHEASKTAPDRRTKLPRPLQAARRAVRQPPDTLPDKQTSLKNHCVFNVFQ